MHGQHVLELVERNALAQAQLAEMEARHARGEHHFVFTGRTERGHGRVRQVLRCSFCPARKLGAEIRTQLLPDGEVIRWHQG